ncbi:hypothetical protein A4D02_25320 [Niastella koreensis]|uniref:Uncharacterized protein n=2 Tax=Niastella koreensis TaxID=354356 RepID=G8TPV3_NIAKG|nr:hypothetical protein Niako_3649 [Niastella koreensis GR20-10]OQP51448.1 hypothetical protein A4D02_25320 [Niastella koreensis]
MKRHWSYYVSPFVIGAIALIPIGISMPVLLIILIPVGFVLLGLDYSLKSLTDGRMLYVWIVEVVLFAVLFYCLNDFTLFQKC